MRKLLLVSMLLGYSLTVMSQSNYTSLNAETDISNLKTINGAWISNNPVNNFAGSGSFQFQGYISLN